MLRREFLKNTAYAAGFLASRKIQGAGMDMKNPGEDYGADNGMIYRELGRTGERVSAIGLGGAHIGVLDSEKESIRIIRSAIDNGITFMDNCWDYYGGKSEERMGRALKDGYRQKVFLMTKFDGRTKEAAEAQINESLRRLQADYVDLIQFHEVIRLEDPDRIFAEGGAVHAALDTQKAGKCRFIGFTGHKDPYVHMRMLSVAEANGFRFDAVQMPLNVMDAHFRSFAEMVVPVLAQRNIGVIGMKPFCEGYALRSNTVTPMECLHYALNLPTSTVVTGIDRMEVLKQDLEAVRTFTPLTETQLSDILTKTGRAASKGRYEPFKTSDIYDGTAHNPQWLGEERKAA